MGKCISTKRYVHTSHKQHLDKEKEDDVTNLVIRPKWLVDITDEYGFCSSIGSGAYATVFRAVSKKNYHCYAIKIVSKKVIKPHIYGMILKEASIVQTLSHPNIVKIYDFVEDYTAYYIVMEIIKNDINKHMKLHGMYSEDKAKMIIFFVLLAVRYIHANHIVHRDIKTSNILIDCTSNNSIIVKVADFGLSTFMIDGYRLWDKCGTVHYMAPEILSAQGYGKAVDMWSIGVMLFIMLYGKYPFYHKCAKKLKKKIIGGNYHFPKKNNDDVSELAKNMIKCLLTVDPYKRISADECIHHPWMKDIQYSIY